MQKEDAAYMKVHYEKIIPHLDGWNRAFAMATVLQHNIDLLAMDSLSGHLSDLKLALLQGGDRVQEEKFQKGLQEHMKTIQKWIDDGKAALDGQIKLLVAGDGTPYLFRASKSI